MELGGEEVNQLLVLDAGLHKLLPFQKRISWQSFYLTAVYKVYSYLFGPGYFSIRVDVHPGEDALGSLLGALLVLHRHLHLGIQVLHLVLDHHLLGAHHRVDRLHDPGHLKQVDPTIAVLVVHTEGKQAIILQQINLITGSFRLKYLTNFMTHFFFAPQVNFYALE